MEVPPIKPIEITDPIAFLKACGETTVDETNEERAQVGALLAKCGYFSSGVRAKGWWAWICLVGRTSITHGTGPTQLAAIQAAVEAAERGVGE